MGKKKNTWNNSSNEGLMDAIRKFRLRMLMLRLRKVKKRESKIKSERVDHTEKAAKRKDPEQDRNNAVAIRDGKKVEHQKRPDRVNAEEKPAPSFASKKDDRVCEKGGSTPSDTKDQSKNPVQNKEQEQPMNLYDRARAGDALAEDILEDLHFMDIGTAGFSDHSEKANMGLVTPCEFLPGDDIDAAMRDAQAIAGSRVHSSDAREERNKEDPNRSLI